MEIENKINDGTILFFDFDGTLVETDYSNFLAYNKAINTILDKNILYNPNERFTREKLLLIFPYLTKKQYEKIIEKKEVYFKEFLSKTKLNKIVYGILNKYSRNNITVLVTNSRKDRALLILNYYNLNDKFDYIFYRDNSICFLYCVDKGRSKKYYYPRTSTTATNSRTRENRTKTSR